MELTGKVAFVTGASRGIGRAIAIALAQQGAHVVALSRTAAATFAGETSIVAHDIDITNEADIARVVQNTVQRFGKIDIVVNNAGVGAFAPAETLLAADWDAMMDTNAKAMFLLLRHTVPHLRAAGNGHILAIASDVSKRTFPNGSIYCASKYAQEGFLGALRQELRPLVRVSVIYPGWVDTSFSGEAGAPEKREWLKPEDIAASALHILAAPPHVVIDELMIHPVVQPYS